MVVHAKHVQRGMFLGLQQLGLQAVVYMLRLVCHPFGEHSGNGRRGIDH
ncbi:UNVERIFIED_CONTAM: hypothetical protein ABID98_004758 [Brevibacillus sp. OAP136]